GRGRGFYRRAPCLSWMPTKPPPSHVRQSCSIHGGLTPMSAEHGSRGNQRKGISPEPSARRRQVTSTAADDWQTVVTCASVSPHWASTASRGSVCIAEVVS